MNPSWSELSPYDRLVDTSQIEPRSYQINIIKSVYTGKNTLVVLPTGLGKTLIAIFAMAAVLHNGKKAIILAPTKPLSEQHHKSLEALLKVEKERMPLLTGTTSASKRKEIEDNAKVIAATPQTISNDIKAGRLNLDDVGIVIFDECHRAAGKYAYTHIADECKTRGIQLLGLTASPGSKREKINELVQILGIENIEIRISSDPDVEPYVMGKAIKTYYVDKTPEINEVANHLRPVIEEHLGKLYHKGLSYSNNFETLPKGRLLEIGDNIKRIQAPSYKFSAMNSYVYVLDLVHAYDLVTCEGLYPFVSYIESLKNRDTKSRAVQGILANPNVVLANKVAMDALAQGFEHPKMFQIVNTIKKEYPSNSMIIFAQYRSTIKKLTDLLNHNGISAHSFVGKKDGVTQASQQQVIQDFRDKKFRALVATSIAEEGLDIPSVDVVMFYEPVASEIRNIQRKGRAGRISFGEVLIFVTKATKDETYLMIGRAKEKRMRELVLKIQSTLAYKDTNDHGKQSTL